MLLAAGPQAPALGGPQLQVRPVEGLEELRGQQLPDAAGVLPGPAHRLADGAGLGGVAHEEGVDRGHVQLPARGRELEVQAEGPQQVGPGPGALLGGQAGAVVVGASSIRAVSWARST